MPADDLALLGARASSSTKQKVWVHGCGNHLTQRGLVLLMCFITSSYTFPGDAKMHLYSLYFSYSPKGSLAHWGRHKMAAISQTTFSNAFSSMKMFEFRLKFQWSLFPRVQLTIFQHWFRYWLGAVQATSHYLNQWWLVYRRIYTSLGLNEFKENIIRPRWFNC